MSLYKKMLTASTSDFQIVGYNAYLGVNIIFLVDSQDQEFLERVRTNKIDRTERNFLVSSVNEYFCDTVAMDDKLFHYAVGNIIIDYMEGKIQLPENLINKQFIDENCMKNTKIKSEDPNVEPTRELVFDKNKFRNLPVSQAVNVVTDMTAFFDDVWAGDYYKSNFDITNLVIPKSDAANLDSGDDEGAEKPKRGRGRPAKGSSSFRQRLASLLKD
jgi:hypothetical protein